MGQRPAISYVHTDLQGLVARREGPPIIGKSTCREFPVQLHSLLALGKI